MKPNQNVKSITSVVVILLSLPAHLDYSSKERKAQKAKQKWNIQMEWFINMPREHESGTFGQKKNP
jgi:hypothetical protein